MSAELASANVFSLYKLSVDCEREIDFDFFDDSPASPWRGKDDVLHGGDDGDSDLGVGGNVPSPRLTAGPTPTSSSGSSTLSTSSSVSLLAPGDSPWHLSDVGAAPGQGHGEQGPQEQLAVDRTSGDAREEDVLEDVFDDVVVAVTPCVRRTPDEATPAPVPSTSNTTREATPAPSTSSTTREATPAPAPGTSSTPEADKATPVKARPRAQPNAQPLAQKRDIRTQASPPRLSVESSGASEIGVNEEDSDEDGEEEASLAIQELTLTVSNKRTRTVSSITAVTKRESCSDDSDADDAIEAITKALFRHRPPSSTSSLPVPLQTSVVRSGKSRRLNMSFTNDEARRIQRENELLLRRIVSTRARPPRLAPAASASARTAPSPVPASTHRCSHTVNRARRVRDIERDNQILLKKIQSVKRSPSQLSMSRSSSSMSWRS